MKEKGEFVKGHGAPLGRPRRILLIQLGDIGDVVLSTPCIRALRDNFPEAKLAVAVRDKAAELLTDCPWLDEVIAVRKSGAGLFGEIVGQIGFVRGLRRSAFDLAIDLRTGTRGAIMARLSGASRRLGFFVDNEAWWRNTLFTDLFRLCYIPELHVADYHLSLLEGYGLPSRHRDPELVVSVGKAAEAERLLAPLKEGGGRLVVVLQPFSLWHYKEWDAEKYVELIRWLIADRQATVLITGAAGERQRAAEVVLAGGPGCHNLAGQTSLALYAAVLKLSHLFIGVDSAGLHIAAAVGTPTVSIFGPSAPSSWAPRGKAHMVVQKSLACVPCRMKGCNNSEKSRCLEELRVEEVVMAVDRQLNAIDLIQR